MEQTKIELSEDMRVFLTTVVELRDKLTDYYDKEFVAMAGNNVSTKDAARALLPIVECDKLLVQVVERLLDYNSHLIRNQIYDMLH